VGNQAGTVEIRQGANSARRELRNAGSLSAKFVRIQLLDPVFTATSAIELLAGLDQLMLFRYKPSGGAMEFMAGPATSFVVKDLKSLRDQSYSLMVVVFNENIAPPYTWERTLILEVKGVALNQWRLQQINWSWHSLDGQLTENFATGDKVTLPNGLGGGDVVVTLSLPAAILEGEPCTVRLTASAARSPNPQDFFLYGLSLADQWNIVDTRNVNAVISMEAIWAPTITPNTFDTTVRASPTFRNFLTTRTFRTLAFCTESSTVFAVGFRRNATSALGRGTLRASVVWKKE
jgi:hypothetical protein